ncbi:hypothetical protein ACFTXM_03240 [Streptomyces sp. NPDC056930]|uniref:hypothetical protein n=1 Tax=Streptomyces sp. NPDC056930 TaxID=3345967 RepID=UPI003644C34F
MLPLVDRAEPCTSYTRDRWAAQEWIPRVMAEADGAALSMVCRRRGMAITSELSLEGAPDAVEITAFGPERPRRSVGYVTTPEQARSLAAPAPIRELRAGGRKPPSQIVGSPSNCGDRPAELS